MRLLVVPGFLGYASESNHLDLVERAKVLGMVAEIVESPELVKNEYLTYRLSAHIEAVKRKLDSLGEEKIALVGVSLGGIAAVAAAKGRLNVRRLICVVSPYKFAQGDDMTPRLKTWESSGYQTFHSSKYGEVEVPYEFVKDAMGYDARNLIGDIPCPKLFLAGSLDQRVPPILSKVLADSASEPKEYRLINGMRHDYKYQPEFVKLVNDYILEFIAG